MEAILDLVFQLYRAAQDTPLGDFADLALSLLQTVIPFCAAAWLAAELERGTLKVLRSHSYGLAADALRSFASPAPQLSRAFALTAANPGRAYQLRVPDLHPDGSHPPLLALADGTRLETQLLIADCGAAWVPASWLSLYRAEGRAKFDERDLRTAGLAMPHLSQALAVNRALHLQQPVPPSILAERLSPQELRVTQLFGTGASHKEVARRLALAPATVRNVLQNAYRKLGINNKAQLARLIAARIDATRL